MTQEQKTELLSHPIIGTAIKAALQNGMTIDVLNDTINQEVGQIKNENVKNAVLIVEKCIIAKTEEWMQKGSEEGTTARKILRKVLRFLGFGKK